MLEYYRLPGEAIGVIPELRVPLESERRWWAGEPIPPDVFFGDVFSAFVVSELERDSRPELLKRLFDFVEEMANDPSSEGRMWFSSQCSRICVVPTSQATGSRLFSGHDPSS